MKTILATTLTASILAVGAFAQTSEVGQRAANQQKRIANGVASGKLTPGEAAHLETREAAIHHETRADRAANGGHLTQGEKQQINRQQNRTSRRIYHDKHN